MRDLGFNEAEIAKVTGEAKAKLEERKAARLAGSIKAEKRRAAQRARAEARKRESPPPQPKLVFSAFETNRRKH